MTTYRRDLRSRAFELAAQVFALFPKLAKAGHRISLRESREANYWARLLATDRAWTKLLQEIIRETAEFVAMLTASVKKLSLPLPASRPLRVPASFRRSAPLPKTGRRRNRRKR